MQHLKPPPKISPAVALFLIAPVFGELFSGSSPLNEFFNPITFITLALLYGCGAILSRELVIRWDKGWPSLVLLGVAYGIYEEGQLVQSFFDPTWMDLGSLAVYERVWGVNWVWAEHLTIFHALISITASVTFVEILYPERRRESWVTSRFWWFANWAGLLIVYIVWEVMTTYNPGFWKVVGWLAILVLGIAARLFPKPPAVRPTTQGIPPPFWFGCLGFLGVFGNFFIIYSGADEGHYPFTIAMLLLAAFDLLVFWLIQRLSKGYAWDDRHRLALINGALSFFLIVLPLIVGRQYPVMYYSHPIFLLGLWLAARKVRRRVLAG